MQSIKKKQEKTQEKKQEKKQEKRGHAHRHYQRARAHPTRFELTKCNAITTVRGGAAARDHSAPASGPVGFSAAVRKSYLIRT
jgi:hypothetical protein